VVTARTEENDLEYHLTSKLSNRAQTTFPKVVRQVLDLHPGDRVAYVIDGQVIHVVKMVDVARPDRVVAFAAEFRARMDALSVGVVIDHDAPIDGTVAT
jgi:bifunctional DNA-binding transcriptional regulator/antitoxin component of YhaV-PrlF toxin-antitoxin module